MPRVSVVLPTYNRRETIAEALESVLSQTCRERDVVIIDDGSTDGTAAYLFARFGAQPRAQEILNEMSPAAMRPFSHAFSVDGSTILYHYQSNRGLSAARNRGIATSRSRYIAFIEADDTWDPRHLEIHLRFHLEHPSAMVSYVGEMPAASTRARAARALPSGWIFEHVLAGSPICISSVFLNRSAIDACGAFDENLEACEDYDLWLRLATRSPIYHLGGAFVLRRSPRRDGTARAWSAEKFRAYALEKAFQGGHLNGHQRLSVAEEIVRKCERLVEGYRRTKSDERASFYERKRKRYSLEVRKLRASQLAQVQR